MIVKESVSNAAHIGPMGWIDSSFDGCILSWQSKRIPTHWMKDLRKRNERREDGEEKKEGGRRRGRREMGEEEEGGIGGGRREMRGKWRRGR